MIHSYVKLREGTNEHGELLVLTCVYNVSLICSLMFHGCSIHFPIILPACWHFVVDESSLRVWNHWDLTLYSSTETADWTAIAECGSNLRVVPTKPLAWLWRFSKTPKNNPKIMFHFHHLNIEKRPWFGGSPILWKQKPWEIRRIPFIFHVPGLRPQCRG